MVFDRVRRLVGGGSNEESNSGSDNVVMPDNAGVIRKTVKKVDLSKGDIREVVERFQEVGAMAYPVINDRAVREDGKNPNKPGQDDGPSFFYVIYEDDEVLVVGGAKSLIRTFAERLNMSKTETKAVIVANRLAADRNGLSEHVVMDDVFMVPKEGGSGAPEIEGLTEEKKKESDEKADRIREIEENGFAIQTSEVFEDSPDLEEKQHFGMNYTSKGNTIEVTLDPDPMGNESHHAVIHPKGKILIPQELAIGLEVEQREVDWRRDEGKIIGRMENGRRDEDVVDVVRTKLAKDNIEEEVQAHLPSSHTSTLGINEDEEVVLRLEPEDDDFAMILSPDTDGETTRNVRIKDIGTGTEILCFAVPEEVADVLGVNDDKERQLEWGLRGEELVGTVVS
jgi:hypothetical protein